MTDPVIHIGYNKTGSTWLQDVLFPRRDLGFLSFLDMKDREEIYRSTVSQHALSFDGSKIRAYYEAKINTPENKGLLPIFSCERFSGDPHSGGYDTKEIADRLKAVFPKSKIIIVVREQQSMLLSTYRQYVRAGGARSLAGYFNPPERGSRRVPMFDFNYFQYDKLITYYQRLFGEEHVLVLPYEWLRKKPEKYVAEILSFCQLNVSTEAISKLPFNQKVNRGYGRITLALKRKYNRYFLDNGLNPGAPWGLPEGAERKVVRFLKRIDQLAPKSWQTAGEKRLKKYIKKQTDGLYSASNIQMEKTGNLELGDLGYEGIS